MSDREGGPGGEGENAVLKNKRLRLKGSRSRLRFGVATENSLDAIEEVETSRTYTLSSRVFLSGGALYPLLCIVSHVSYLIEAAQNFLSPFSCSQRDSRKRGDTAKRNHPNTLRSSVLGASHGSKSAELKRPDPTMSLTAPNRSAHDYVPQ